MANGNQMCGICGKRWLEGIPKMTLYNLPVPTGDCYTTRQALLCRDCCDFVEDLTKKKVIEIGYAVEDRRKLFREAAKRKRGL